MSKLFSKLKVYDLGGTIAFQELGATVPFLALPKGKANIKSWAATGFVFENIITGDIIGYVDTYDDVLTAADATYGANQSDVMTALAEFFDGAAAVVNVIDQYGALESFSEIAGNSIEYTYYAGVEAGNPSGTTTNVKTIVYKTGVTTIITKTIAYDANDLVISITTA